MEIADYLTRILQKEAFDQSGLIYGIGHAVYTVSDPRTKLLRDYARALAYETGREEEYELYTADRAPGSRSLPRRQEKRQDRLRQCRLLFRLRLQHAGHPAGTVHADFRRRPDRRLERPPDRGAASAAAGSSAQPTNASRNAAATRQWKDGADGSIGCRLAATQNDPTVMYKKLTQSDRHENASPADAGPAFW